MRRTPKSNTLFYGDNLDILREYIEDETIDLIYLDPPFNSNANYNVLFRAPGGEQSQSQIEAFEDTWKWNATAEKAFDEVLTSGNSDAAEMLRAMRSFLKENDMMAYLTMMAVRLLELHRVLKPTGSLYLHCDPTASHYLKVLIDAIFGARQFQNEIAWKRTFTHGDSRTWSRAADKIFFYTKSDDFCWNIPYDRHADTYVESHYSNIDENGRRYQLTSILSPSPRPNMTYDWKGFPPPPMGWRFSRETMAELDTKNLIWYPRRKDGSLDVEKRPRFKRYLDEQKGTVLTTIWTDIPPINSRAQERLGYPTQKPLALLERIISASSDEGAMVLDPFCGCGTTVHAAQKLKRRWIGIDVTHLAVGLVRRRLIDAFPRAKFDVLGVPKDIGAARELAKADPHQFQLWALSMIEAQPYKGGKKGADSGIDGLIYFKPDGRTTEKAIVEVKGGENVSPQWVRALGQVVDRERAKIGVLVMLTDPTTTMKREASAAGLYKPEGDVDWSRTPFEKIQILTIEDIFDGRKPHTPWVDPTSGGKRAKREATKIEQGKFDL